MIRILIAIALGFIVSIARADGKHNPSAEYDKVAPEEQEEFDQLTDTLIQTWCDANSLIASAQENVDRQKKIQKLTGTADVNALHFSGAMIVDMTEKRNNAAKLYKKTFGKELNKKQCEDL